MAVENTLRRAGPYVSDGVGTGFSFTFRVFKPEDVAVSVSSTADDNAQDVALNYLDDYVVELNLDQEHNPGGVAVLNNPVAEGIRVTLVSQVEDTQETVLTNHDGFSPKILNDVHDKLTILIQQLKESTDRTIQVPKTSPKTPAQILNEILDTASTANEYAIKAEQIYTATLATQSQVEQTRIHVDNQKAKVDASEAEVEEDRIEVEQMLRAAQEVGEVTAKIEPHLGEIVSVGNSIEDVKAVASELQGYPILSMDLGLVTEEASPIQDASGSNIAYLAENIDEIKLAIANLEQIKTAAQAAVRAETAAQSAETSAANASVYASDAKSSVERVKEIEKTDFEQIYEQGVN